MPCAGFHQRHLRTHPHNPAGKDYYHPLMPWLIQPPWMEQNQRQNYLRASSPKHLYPRGQESAQVNLRPVTHSADALPVGQTKRHSAHTHSQANRAWPTSTSWSVGDAGVAPTQGDRNRRANQNRRITKPSRASIHGRKATTAQSLQPQGVSMRSPAPISGATPVQPPPRKPSPAAPHPFIDKPIERGPPHSQRGAKALHPRQSLETEDTGLAPGLDPTGLLKENGFPYPRQETNPRGEPPHTAARTKQPSLP